MGTTMVSNVEYGQKTIHYGSSKCFYKCALWIQIEHCLIYYLIDCHAVIVIFRNIPIKIQSGNVHNTSDGFVAVVTLLLYEDSISRNNFKTEQLNWICRKIMWVFLPCTWTLRGHCRVINWTSFNVAMSQGIGKPKEREKDEG